MTNKPRTLESRTGHASRGAAKCPAVRRAGAALEPATPLEILVSRALDQELDWYFSYAEAALRRQDVAMLPSYAASRVFAGGAPDAGATSKLPVVRIKAEASRLLRGAIVAYTKARALEGAALGVA